VAGQFGGRCRSSMARWATSALALAMAVPLGLGAAIFLSELAPARISDALTFVIELLAAVPSVIYGLLGVFVLVPIMRALGAPYGVGVLTAAVVLAVMILPFIVSISREALPLSAPRAARGRPGSGSHPLGVHLAGGGPLRPAGDRRFGVPGPGPGPWAKPWRLPWSSATTPGFTPPCWPPATPSRRTSPTSSPRPLPICISAG